MLTALFGGTFDPIHYGHLRPALALAKEIGLSSISLLPNRIPPHKPQPGTTTEQRLAMLKLAIADYPFFTIDTRELQPQLIDQPSFTIDTLKAWREQNGAQSALAFIMGQDSLLSLPTWKEWQKLVDYCHLLICKRPGYAQPTFEINLQTWINQHQTKDIQALHHSPNGYIYFANTPLEAISATEIRQNIDDPQSCKKLLPAKVWQYIHEYGLYNSKKC
ncbi:nicotinate-nucleotide adenylyltransferase [Gilliamella apicola]|uniref:Probable nicotinate-nucleotide adenylyltransferase n=1 Tax=Gilliamella apicola TaxID=1196095 RepID=A0A2V4DZX0_9GAMM|nr:nicotinate-nucleotide adenylyltransferase [Gilliamella apicola]KES17427.1 Nicotinic acid mononucleotide adenylyltransferase [Gilliamella apicola SCGC AB-598-I20]PXZ04481.1 nicotinate-nucleotide adenylyltransferase [Gilliamella apicola]